MISHCSWMIFLQKILQTCIQWLIVFITKHTHLSLNVLLVLYCLLNIRNNWNNTPLKISKRTHHHISPNKILESIYNQKGYLAAIDITQITLTKLCWHIMHIMGTLNKLCWHQHRLAFFSEHVYYMYCTWFKSSITSVTLSKSFLSLMLFNVWAPLSMAFTIYKIYQDYQRTSSLYVLKYKQRVETAYSY